MSSVYPDNPGIVDCQDDATLTALAHRMRKRHNS